MGCECIHDEPAEKTIQRLAHGVDTSSEIVVYLGLKVYFSKSNPPMKSSGIVIVTVMFVFACSGSKTESTYDPKAETPRIIEASGPQFATDSVWQGQMGNMFDEYILLKDAFVNSDSMAVKTQAKKLNALLARMEGNILSGTAKHDWENYLTGMQRALDEIYQSSDLEAQRLSFRNLSDALYKSIKAFGLGGKQGYFDFCPMAFNDEGAYWISDKKEIRNPYFGDRMLTCGVVKEKLK